MKRLVYLLLTILLLSSFGSDIFAQRRRSSYHSSTNSYKTYKPQYKYNTAPKKQTSNISETKYKTGENYKSSGLPKVERSTTTKKEFLKSRGYDKTPVGYEVDHVVPLSKGGADKPYNMQLLPKEAHKQKTANERRMK